MDVTQTESTVVGSGARSRPTATATVLVGAVCGLAWAAAFRGWMAELAGGASRLEWYGTFVAILTIAVPLIGIAGGFAVSGRGPIWARILCGVLTVAFLVALVFTVPSVGGIRVALDQPRGAWVATLGVACVLVLCLASSIPFRRVVPVGDPAPTIRGPG